MTSRSILAAIAVAVGLAPASPGLVILAAAGATPTAAAAEPVPVEVARQRQLVAQLRESLQPAARAELELVRRTCGSLPGESRAAIVAAADEGLTQLAGKHIQRQQRGGRKGFDSRGVIHATIAPVLEPLVPAEEFAAYEREHAARLARRARTARLRIMDKLLDTLDLSAAQTAAIEADLQRRWQSAWLAELDDHGMIANGARLAPDFAAEAITPHLDERQRAAWDDWCRRAPSSTWRGNVDLGGRCLEADPWWQP